jgi:predicted transcriptional regulator
MLKTKLGWVDIMKLTSITTTAQLLAESSKLPSVDVQIDGEVKLSSKGNEFLMALRSLPQLITSSLLMT